jgi:hypothetical protein
MLNLEAYFKKCSLDYEYCVLRMSDDFPAYKPGDDIDILCRDVLAAIEYTQKFVGRPVRTSFRASGHTHVNVYNGKRLHFRFDFIDTLQVYERFAVSDRMLDAVLASKVMKRSAFVPGLAFDLALRHMEYVERPEKKRHKFTKTGTELDRQVARILAEYTSINV